MVSIYPYKHWLLNLLKSKQKGVSPKVLALGYFPVEDVQSRVPGTSTGRFGDVLLIANGSISSMSMRVPISSPSLAEKRRFMKIFILHPTTRSIMTFSWISTISDTIEITFPVDLHRTMS